jgi:hypothetical protein
MGVDQNSDAKYLFENIRPQHISWTSGFDSTTASHQQNNICELRGQIDVMSYKQRGDFLLIAACSYDGEQRGLVRQIEVGSWFIEQEYWCFCGEGTCQYCALSFAT